MPRSRRRKSASKKRYYNGNMGEPCTKSAQCKAKGEICAADMNSNIGTCEAVRQCPPKCRGKCNILGYCVNDISCSKDCPKGHCNLNTGECSRNKVFESDCNKRCKQCFGAYKDDENEYKTYIKQECMNSSCQPCFEYMQAEEVKTLWQAIRSY